MMPHTALWVNQTKICNLGKGGNERGRNAEKKRKENGKGRKGRESEKEILKGKEEM